MTITQLIEQLGQEGLPDNEIVPVFSITRLERNES